MCVWLKKRTRTDLADQVDPNQAVNVVYIYVIHAYVCFLEDQVNNIYFYQKDTYLYERNRKEALSELELIDSMDIERLRQGSFGSNRLDIIERFVADTCCIKGLIF